MKSFILTFVILILTSCSFDNKTGIWKDASNIPIDNKDSESIKGNVKSRYENIFTKKKQYNEEKNLSSEYILKLDPPIKIENWTEEYGAKSNNISNYAYGGNKKLLSKSSKLKKLSSNKNIVFYDNNLITFDHKGKIFIYSLDLRKKTFQYNFYKKSYKNIKKDIYLTTSEDVLYVADNLGYIYAIDLNNRSLIWAKNYGIPFRSNLKVIDEQILVANHDNVIYSIDIKTGDKNWQFATVLTFLKSDFKNNLSLDVFNNNLFFLNTSGEFYSINYLNQKINWVLNFKNRSLAEDTNLFLSQPVVLNRSGVVISTENSVFSYDLQNGSRNWIFPARSILKPVLTSNYLYMLTKNNLLICLNNKTGEVLWSKNIYKDILKGKLKKKIGTFFDFKISDNELNFFSKNGYLLSFNFSSGNLESIKKLSKNGISSEVFFLNNNMFLIDNHNKLLKFN